MESQPPVQPAPKKNNLPMMLGIGAAMLLCCCALVVGAFFVVPMLLGPSVGNVFSQINVETPGVPEFLTPIVSDTQTPSSQNPGSGDLPQGGNTDNLLRGNTWTLVQVLASAKGCNTPSAANTTIEVAQAADASGIWKELWNVACESGGPVKVEVTFTPSAQGGTDISVSVAP